MDFRIFIEPQQGASYDDQLRLAQAAERLGFNGFFRSDHFLAMGDRDGLPGPTDSWVTLAGLARETTTIRLGTLVSAATFRRSEEHTSELQSRGHLVCRLLLEKKNTGRGAHSTDRPHPGRGR